MCKYFFNVTVLIYLLLNLFMFFSLEPSMHNYDIYRTIFAAHILVFFQILWAKLVLLFTGNNYRINEHE